MRLTPHRLKSCAPQDLRPGDHIAVRRPGIYIHHGIFLGGGRVAHFSDEAGLISKMRARVKESSLEEFLQGGRLLRRRHRRPHPPEIVVIRARAVMIGEIPWAPYHLVQNNCEHFATFCAARRSRSAQVQQVAGGVAVMVAGAAVGALLQRRTRRNA